MTGDDHGSGGTAGRFDARGRASPPGCSVDDWECVRSTSYIYTATPLTDAQAATLRRRRASRSALHVEHRLRGLTRRPSLERHYASQLAAGRRSTRALPAPSTNRTHCIVVERLRHAAAGRARSTASGSTRTTTTGPAAWVARPARPVHRLGHADAVRRPSTATLIDVYQAATQMTDESGQIVPGHDQHAARPRARRRWATTACSPRTCTPTAAHSPAADGDRRVGAGARRAVVSARQMLTGSTAATPRRSATIVVQRQRARLHGRRGARANGLQGMVPA